MQKGSVTSPAVWFEPPAQGNYNANSHTNYGHHLGRELCIRHASLCNYAEGAEAETLALTVWTYSCHHVHIPVACWLLPCLWHLFNRPSYSQIMLYFCAFPSQCARKAAKHAAPWIHALESRCCVSVLENHWYTIIRAKPVFSPWLWLKDTVCGSILW